MDEPTAPSGRTMPGGTHVLVVDDDPRIGSLLTRYLELHGMQVTVVPNLGGLRAFMAEPTFDVLLLDLGLPDGDGLDALRELRARWHGPVLIISGQGEPVERVVGLELGADDYVLKPFDLRELLARIRSVLRRTAAPETGLPAAIRLDGLRIDPAARTVTGREGEPLELTRGEFDLLLAFAAQPGRPLSRDALMTVMHGRAAGPFDRAIDVQVGRLRRKIERDPAHPSLLKSLRGVGYVLCHPPGGG